MILENTGGAFNQFFTRSFNSRFKWFSINNMSFYKHKGKYTVFVYVYFSPGIWSLLALQKF